MGIIGSILGRVGDTLHRDCDGNIAFLQSKIEQLRAENRRLRDQNDRLRGVPKSLADELHALKLKASLARADATAWENEANAEHAERIKLVERFVQLARSRNRYRRKYVKHHIATKAARVLAEAVGAFIRKPHATTHEYLKQAYQPFCEHWYVDTLLNAQGLVTSKWCSTCGIEMNESETKVP